MATRSMRCVRRTAVRTRMEPCPYLFAVPGSVNPNPKKQEKVLTPMSFFFLASVSHLLSWVWKVVPLPFNTQPSPLRFMQQDTHGRRARRRRHAHDLHRMGSDPPEGTRPLVRVAGVSGTAGKEHANDPVRPLDVDCALVHVHGV